MIRPPEKRTMFRPAAPHRPGLAVMMARLALYCAILLFSSPSLAAGEAQRPARPELPWLAAEQADYPPGQPGRDYQPVFVPNGQTLPFKVKGGVKVMHLTAEPIIHEVAPGLRIHAWGFNGGMPGPLVEVVQGEKVRIYVSNRLPARFSLHWHGVILPCGQDGVFGVTQPAIQPGETYVYEFIFPHAGTFMYHSHVDTMTQEGMGLVGMIVVHPRERTEPAPDRDFALMLHEWAVEGGTARPNTLENTDFNVVTFNGKVFPATHPLVAQLGDRVRIRFGNLSAMHNHPIHLHGYNFQVVETDGGPVPPGARWPETTVLVPVGSVRVVELLADNPGDWAMHCHMTHHTMNQMGHTFGNMVGVDPGGVDEKIRKLLPGYMTMGTRGMMSMQDMVSMGMEMPPNSIPMLGNKGQFGQTTMGGMAGTLKVREHAPGYADPGDYRFPKGSVAHKVSDRDMKRDGVKPPAPPLLLPGHDMRRGMSHGAAHDTGQGAAHDMGQGEHQGMGHDAGQAMPQGADKSMQGMEHGQGHVMQSEPAPTPAPGGMEHGGGHSH